MCIGRRLGDKLKLIVDDDDTDRVGRWVCSRLTMWDGTRGCRPFGCPFERSPIVV